MLKLFLFLLTGCSLHAFAQNQTTGVKLAHYALEAFSRGTIKMKSGEAYSQLLNYNILTNEIIFDAGNGFMAINDPQNVDTVNISGRIFVPVDKVFFELLGHTHLPLFMEYNYSIKEPGASIGYGMNTNTSAAASLNNLIESGSAYALKLPDDFQVIPSHVFWIRKDEKYLRVSNAQSLTKIFPNSKEEIKDFVKNNNTDFSKQEDVLLLVQQLQK